MQQIKMNYEILNNAGFTNEGTMFSSSIMMNMMMYMCCFTREGTA